MTLRILSPALKAVRGTLGLYLRARRRQLLAELSNIQKQDPEAVSVIDGQLLREEQGIVRFLLRRFPYWSAGHVELGRVALALDDVSTAYASALAVQKLGGSSSESGKLLARCYLRRADPRSALSLLEEVVAVTPGDWEAKEDIAACHLALGEDERAEAVLDSIPERFRSPAALEALKYARFREKMPR